MFFLTLFDNSCKKDISTSSNIKLVEETGEFADLKKIYNQRISVLSGIKTAFTSSNKFNFIKTLAVDWKSHRSYLRYDSSIVTEFKMNSDTGLITFSRSAKPNSSNFFNKTKVVFIKFKNGKRLNFFMKVIEDNSSNGQHSEIDSLYYGHVPSYFRGAVLYYTLDRKFINGSHYMFGKPVGRVSFNDNENTTVNNLVERKKVNALQYCTQYDYYRTDCQTVSYAGYTYDSGCTETYIGSEISCVPAAGGGSGGPGGSGSGGGGGGDGVTNDPGYYPPGCEIIGHSSVKDKMKILIENPGDGGGGSGGDQQPCPPARTPAGVADDLSQELKNNPGLLLPCAEVQKFAALARFTPPQAVMNRISSLNSQSTEFTLFSQHYYVQKIQDAAGYLVNLDRFEINVASLLVINGVRVDAAQFLNYIRLNMNQFIDNGIATFDPYNDPSDNINDSNLWNSSNPLGAIRHLDLADNGSIILSDYATDHFTVSTIRTPIDGSHPVSGNRSWGYQINPNGSYTYYVTGADRLTSDGQEVAQIVFGLPFYAADRLWKSFQSKVAQFVINSQGSATVGAITADRPSYYQLAKYFNGVITLSQLKAVNGCY